ncbi:MAG: hypothetical protein F2690_00655 [Actinobacteria bacterium]|uniref:Unannotated protein n=1 Tax=freshwater metagenome TaxID=449393 RepID=A0A6J5YUD6_9ZZZZ|nr:hypothetical protein [Actinomycetota bacterium]MSX71565.1 hypothetical protein [Actinomycetota bacterium]MSY69069.1 hypothetical protein [Actinomycetota bacterium]MTA75510.1 hypothetical protein [Actinomycetota bacterium]
MRSRRIERVIEDDMVDKAGWMYADLFLGLMVIFLATISFVPEIRDNSNANAGNRVSSNTIRQSTSFNFDKGLTIVINTPDVLLIETRIKSFLAGERLPLDSQIVFVKFIGGYDPINERVSDGATRALEFGLKLRADNPKLFANATNSADASPDIASGQVAVVLTFSSPLKK